MLTFSKTVFLLILFTQSPDGSVNMDLATPPTLSECQYALRIINRDYILHYKAIEQENEKNGTDIRPKVLLKAACVKIETEVDMRSVM